MFLVDDAGIPSSHGTNQTSPITHQDLSLYDEETVSQLSHQLSHHLPTGDFLTYGQSDYRHPSMFASHSGALQGNGPRIEITCPDLYQNDHVHTNPVNISRPMLDIPYRENQCLSPASSTSSTSWHSDGYSPGTYSPCVSPGVGEGTLARLTEAVLCPMMQAIQASGSPNTSPRTSITEDTVLDRRPTSPRSRSTSPQGKRTYAEYKTQRSQSPCFSRDEPAEFYPLENLQDSIYNLSHNLTKPIPTKIVRPNLEYSVYTESHVGMFTPMPEVKKEFTVEPCYFMPANWSSQALAGVCRYDIIDQFISPVTKQQSYIYSFNSLYPLTLVKIKVLYWHQWFQWRTYNIPENISLHKRFVTVEKVSIDLVVLYTKKK